MSIRQNAIDNFSFGGMHWRQVGFQQDPAPLPNVAYVRIDTAFTSSPNTLNPSLSTKNVTFFYGARSGNIGISNGSAPAFLWNITTWTMNVGSIAYVGISLSPGNGSIESTLAGGFGEYLCVSVSGSVAVFVAISFFGNIQVIK